LKKVVVLFSGGVESSCLLYLYLSKGWIVYPAYVITGNFWEKFEYRKASYLWSYAKKTYPRLMPIRSIVLKASQPKYKLIKTEEQLFIPLRNLTLLTAVGNYAISKSVYHIGIGSLGLYPFPDNNFNYIKEVQALMSRGANISLTVDVPLIGMKKSEVVRRFKDLVPFHLTFSCINPVVRKGKVFHCNRCIKCIERKEALKELDKTL